MKPFCDLFSISAIERELCRARVGLAEKANDRLFWFRISKAARPPVESELYRIFPKRRQWNCYRPKRRDGRTSGEVNQAALWTTVRRLRENCEQTGSLEPEWSVKLAARAKSIRDRVFGTLPFAFDSPTIIPEAKDLKTHEYRPIAQFPLDDKIIDSLAARYFRTLLEGVLTPSCIAFRMAPKGETPPSIHTALKELLRARDRHPTGTCWVAECDIRSFYDSVSHTVAMAELEKAILETKVGTVDADAMRIFKAYLACYSYQKVVRIDATAKLQQHDPKGWFKWCDRVLAKLHNGGALDEIGVPQGGALSCVIANVVLHAADKAVLDHQTAWPSLKYLRYCDDMVIVAPSQSACKTAFAAYRRSLLELKLPYHRAKAAITYGPSFWNGKSRRPYRWSPSSVGGIPWIQFVGFQIRHDGVVRIRKKSVEKHIKKLVSTADSMIQILCPRKRRDESERREFSTKLRKNRYEIRHRFRMKLLALSVGRIKLNSRGIGPRPACWCFGFRGLYGRRMPAYLLRKLDYHRERQFQRVWRLIKELADRDSTPQKKTKPLKCYGKPFSHSAQLPACGPTGRIGSKGGGF